MKRLTSSLLIASILATTSLPAAWADASTADGQVRGNVLVKDATGNWQPTSDLQPGSWVKAADSSATLNVSGVMIRMTEGATAQLVAVTPEAVSVKMGSGEGRVFVNVPSGIKLDLQAGGERVKASNGEFVLGYGAQNRLEVFSGDAVGSKAQRGMYGAKAWASEKELALAGPDTQRRPTNQVENTNTQTQNAGEDQTMSPTFSPSPTETWTPTTTPTWTPTASPTPTRTATVEGGGTEIWPFILGGLALGGLIYYLVDDDDDDDIIFASF